MNKIKILISVVLIWASQINCSAPRQSLPSATPLLVVVEAPSRILRGEKYQFIIQTSPVATCHAGVNFWNAENRWVFEEFPTIQANALGVCEWNWEAPIRAQNGVAEFRGFVKTSTQYTSLMPKTFCIEVEKCE